MPAGPIPQTQPPAPAPPPARRSWLAVAALVGVAYFVIGVGFATPAASAPSLPLRNAWRLAAWLASAVVFAGHIGYECLRHRSPPHATAVRASAGAAIGALLLAVRVNLRAEWLAAGPHHPVRLALVAWPVVTALPAFVVARVAAAALSRIVRVRAPRPDRPEPVTGKE